MIDKSHNNYRTDFAAESAAAFADAGARYNEPDLTAAARATTHHLLASAANPNTHLFPLQMNYAPSGDTVGQDQIKMGEQAQTLDSLLTVYDHVHDPAILAAVRAAVDELYSPTLGLHDALLGGFFFSVNSDGSGLSNSYKETRQAWMLATLEHLNTEVGGQEQRIAEMQKVVLGQLWQSSISGYVYRTTTDFKIYTNHSGGNHASVQENFVTAEAMGIAGNVIAPRRCCHTPFRTHVRAMVRITRTVAGTRTHVRAGEGKNPCTRGPRRRRMCARGGQAVVVASRSNQAADAHHPAVPGPLRAPWGALTPAVGRLRLPPRPAPPATRKFAPEWPSYPRTDEAPTGGGPVPDQRGGTEGFTKPSPWFKITRQEGTDGPHNRYRWSRIRRFGDRRLPRTPPTAGS